MTQVGPKANDKCPYKRQKGENRHRRGHMKVEIGVMQPKGMLTATRSQRGEKEFSSRGSKKNVALPIP